MLVPGRRLTRNAARCNNCGNLLESTPTALKQKCSCGALTVSGGYDHTHRQYSGPLDSMFPKFYELSEYSWNFDIWEVGTVSHQFKVAEWIKENGFPEDGNWSKEQKVLFTLSYGI